MRRLFILLLLLSPSAVAAPVVFEDARVTLQVPDGWTATLDPADHTLNVAPPDDGAMLLFSAVPRRALTSALGDIEKTLKTLVTQPKLGEATTMKLNGMDAIVGDGAGTMDGKAVELGIMIVQVPGDRVLLFIGMVPKLGADKYEAGVTELIGSIRPLEKAPTPGARPAEGTKAKTKKGSR